MTNVQDIASKLSVALVAIVMAFALVAPAAHAQSETDLQQMINDLLAQVASLQGQLGQGGSMSAAGVCPFTWTRDLTTGASGADVMKLQQFLNADPDTRVAATGVGSAGMETEYFGGLTAEAVSKFQVKYRSEVLSPSGLVNPTGYFGPSSRGKANALCVSAPSTGDTTGDTTGDDTTGDDDDSGDMSLSGEADLDEFTVDSPDDDSVQEGDEDAPIGVFTVIFKNGDAEINRLDLAVQGGDDETDPWDTFDSISLWVDGDKIAEEDASSRRDYLDEDNGSLRFSNLELIAREDEEVEITVAANLQSGMDDSSDGEDWSLYAGSMRFFDADGVATDEDDFGDMKDTYDDTSADFTIEEAGYDDEIIVKTSNNDPDAATLQVEDDSKSDWYTVFIFDLDTDDSINDIMLNDIFVDVAVSSGTYNGIVDDARLVIDGETIDSSSADLEGSTGSTATGTIDFDVDGEVTIDAGDRVEAKLELRFKSLAVGNEGVTVQGMVTTANANNIDAEGADDLTNSGTDQLRGSATGEKHTLRTEGVDVSPDTISSSVTTQDGNNNDYATFSIQVEITAFEQDVYIDTKSASGTVWHLEDGSGNTISGVGTTTPVLTSSADEVDGYFEITEGETETLKLKVTFLPGTTKSARLVLDSIEFADSQTDPDQSQTTLPKTDYRTDVETIVN